MALSSGMIVDIVIGAAALSSGVYLGYKKLRETRLTRNKGLDPNPERCAKHEDRIGDLEKSCATYQADIGHIKGDISEIKDDVKHLIGLHIKP